MSEREASPHPRPEELRGFMEGELPQATRQQVVRHLLAGCEPCSAAVAAALFPPAADAERYDLPVHRALAVARRYAARLAAAREAALDDLVAILVHDARPAPAATSAGLLAWCELLLGLVQARKFDARSTYLLAVVAAMAADRLEPSAELSVEALADLRARSRAELSNAFRVAGDLAGAEAELGAALRHLDAGTGDPLLAARIADLAGSLFRHQRRFDEAAAVLESARSVYLAHGEPHLAGRVLVNLGLTLGYAGRPEAAIGALSEALGHLDEEREPALVLAAVHNLLLFLVDCGRLDSARRLLWRVRRLSKECGGPVDRARLLGIEAKLEVASGHPRRAERLFRRELEILTAEEQPFAAAVTAVDLAAVLVETGHAPEASRLIDDAMTTFWNLGVARELIAALALHHRAEADAATTAARLRALAARIEREGPPPGRRDG